jgi:AAA15 family ATPase/GTPase
MRVQQISFTGFKSLHDLTLPLGDLTVITGPNGSGKSNILAGIGFLSDVYSGGLANAMESADDRFGPGRAKDMGKRRGQFVRDV